MPRYAAQIGSLLPDYDAPTRLIWEMWANIRASIMGAQYRLGGDEYGDTFKAAFTATHEALFPRMPVHHQTPEPTHLRPSKYHKER